MMVIIVEIIIIVIMMTIIMIIIMIINVKTITSFIFSMKIGLYDEKYVSRITIKR